jgi:hypothetical protein
MIRYRDSKGRFRKKTYIDNLIEYDKLYTLYNYKLMKELVNFKQ